MTTDELNETRQQLGKALGRLASGVFVVTVESSGKRDGMLATFINQVAFDPPSIAAAVNKQRDILQMLAVNAAFTVNVLSSKNMNIFKAFAKPHAGGADNRFNGFNLQENNGGGPVFADAVSYINCRTIELIDAGDHTIVLAEVIGGALLNAEDQPMVHLRNNGFQY